MQLKSTQREWALPLVLTLAAVLQGVHVFTTQAGFLAGSAFGLLAVGVVVAWSDYLYSRGTKSARTLPGKLLQDGEDRVE